MGKFDGILLCTDFDLTLGKAGSVSPENCEAIRYFQQNGGRFTIVSGRHPDFLRDHQKGFSVNAPLVGYNGALIKDENTGEILYSGGRQDHKAFDLAIPFWKRNLRIRRIVSHDATANDLSCDRTVEKGSFATVEEMRANTDIPLYNLICVTHEPKDAESLRDDLASIAGDAFEIARSWSLGVEIICVTDTKGAAVKRLKEMLGIKLLVAVGDFENDISMLKAADIGYAVDNAVPEVKAVADRITVDFQGHAIAAIVADLEKEL